MLKLIKGIWSIIPRQVYRVFENFRRHRFTLRRASVSQKVEKNIREGTWWGKEKPWFSGGTPPRLHNKVTPLVDGENFFNELRKALEQAEKYVFIIGWAFTPYIPIDRTDLEQVRKSRLIKLLDQASQKASVRILLWNGANFLFEPDKKGTSQVKKEIEEEAHGDLKICLDSSQHFTHCHHQKAIVFDGRVAFVGGMDLTTLFADRFDTNKHPLRAGLNWHDVQLKLEGEVVADVEKNFRQRWEAVALPSDRELYPPQPANEDLAGNIPAQIVRTIPRKVYKFADRGEFGIYHSLINLISEAKHFIYIENQYFWSTHVFEALSKAINTRRTGPFRIMVVLPASADDGKYDNDKHVARLRKLDKGRGIISFYSLYTSGPNMGHHAFTYREIYVHSKTVIIDDEWFLVGSANLNNRGLITDSEIDALVHDPDLARELRLALWAEHLNMSPSEVAGCSVKEMADRVWPGRAKTNRAIYQKKNEPFQSALYPYMIGKKPDEWVLEELEELTFEH